MAITKRVHALFEGMVSTFIWLKKIEKNEPNNNKIDACKKEMYRIEIVFALALYFGL
jgi:cyanate permease